MLLQHYLVLYFIFNNFFKHQIGRDLLHLGSNNLF